MNEFIKQLSSYNILNYLIPGVVFAFLCNHYTSFSVLIPGSALALFLYYFYGMIISRVGSIIIEPIFKGLKIVVFAPYTDFVKASREDAQLVILSEQNNVYRTIISMIVCILGCMGFELLATKYPWLQESYGLLLVLSLLVMFSLAYRKQTSYVRNRVVNDLKPKRGDN